jgi:hypothetical protein
MTTKLRQCTECHRHVRDAHCPFCGAIVAHEGRGAVTVAAVMAAVAVGVAGAACGSGTPPQTPADQPSASASDSATPATSGSTSTPPTASTPRAGAVYGSPPPQP